MHKQIGLKKLQRHAGRTDRRASALPSERLERRGQQHGPQALAAAKRQVAQGFRHRPEVSPSGPRQFDTRGQPRGQARLDIGADAPRQSCKLMSARPFVGSTS